MKKTRLKTRKALNRVRLILYWTIPFIIFYVIFRRIDLNLLWSNIAKSNPWLCAVGTALCFLAVLVGGWRWHILLNGNDIGKPRLWWVLRHYWIGLALGHFTPASVGWEAYRVIASGRRFGKYSLNLTIVMAEKIIAAVIGALMIIMVYPMLSTTVDMQFKSVMDGMYFMVGLCLIFYVGTKKLFRSDFVHNRLKGCEKKAFYVRDKLLSKLGLHNKGTNPPYTLSEMPKPIRVPKKIMPIVLLTIFMRLITAFGHQAFFYSLDVKMPFVANLFVALLLFFVFVLPISFGGFGVREGAFIMLYKPFGVPAETALIVSFFTLFAMILNYLIGVLFMVVPSRNE